MMRAPRITMFVSPPVWWDAITDHSSCNDYTTPRLFHMIPHSCVPVSHEQCCQHVQFQEQTRLLCEPRSSGVPKHPSRWGHVTSMETQSRIKEFSAHKNYSYNSTLIKATFCFVFFNRTGLDEYLEKDSWLFNTGQPISVEWDSSSQKISANNSCKNNW